MRVSKIHKIGGWRWHYPTSSVQHLEPGSITFRYSTHNSPNNQILISTHEITSHKWRFCLIVCRFEFGEIFIALTEQFSRPRILHLPKWCCHFRQVILASVLSLCNRGSFVHLWWLYLRCSAVELPNNQFWTSLTAWCRNCSHIPEQNTIIAIHHRVFQGRCSHQLALIQHFLRYTHSPTRMGLLWWR